MRFARIGICAVLWACAVSVARAEVAAPVLSRAEFTSAGKLKVAVKEFGPEGCYITLNGGLTRGTVTTGIISTSVTASNLEKTALTITTKRKYYCRRRTLYVQIEKVCLGDVIGSAVSAIRSVKVPSKNVR